MSMSMIWADVAPSASSTGGTSVGMVVIGLGVVLLVAGAILLVRARSIAREHARAALADAAAPTGASPSGGIVVPALLLGVGALGVVGGLILVALAPSEPAPRPPRPPYTAPSTIPGTGTTR